MLDISEEVRTRVRGAKRLQLFLDYDGTLADFAPTPDHVEPEPDVIALVTQLTRQPRIRITVISGRRLDHVEQLLPVREAVLAGTYGIELRFPDGRRVDRVPFDQIRPVLEAIKPQWEDLLAGREGFFLEDKAWALAIHARYADDEEAEAVLEKARQMATVSMDDADREMFRVLGGHKFLEIGPAEAHKGKTVAYLLDRYAWSGALPLYIGDDDKDEEAFHVIQDHGGVAIKVCKPPCDTDADGVLTSPQDVRRWLESLGGPTGQD